MRTVVVSGARSFAALEIVRAFSLAGWRTIAVDVPRNTPTGWSRHCHRYERMASPRLGHADFRRSVERIVERHAPDLWIPTCEEIFHLAALALPDLPLLGSPIADLLAVHDKFAFARTAEIMGLAPERTTLLRSGSDLDALSGLDRLVLKPVWSRFGSRIAIRPRRDELRLLTPSDSDPWVAQTFLPGDEASVYCIARGGELIAYSAYSAPYRAAGAGIYFEPLPDQDLESATEGIVRALHWNGQVAFDFRKDAAGSWKAIECNPRSTSGIHLLAPEDLVAAFTGIDGPTAAMTGSARMIAPAMMTYGLAASDRSLNQWIKDFRGAKDVVNDTRAFAGMLFLSFEMAAKAISNGQSMILASTEDIEWNAISGTVTDCPASR